MLGVITSSYIADPDDRAEMIAAVMESLDEAPLQVWSPAPVSPGEATPQTATVDFDEAVGSALHGWRGLTINQRDQWEKYPWPEAAFIASHIHTFAGGSPVAETRTPTGTADASTVGDSRLRDLQAGAEALHGIWMDSDNTRRFIAVRYPGLAHGIDRVTRFVDGSVSEVVRQEPTERTRSTFDDDSGAECTPACSEMHQFEPGCALAPAVEGTTPTGEDAQRQAQAAMQRVAQVFTSHGWDEMAGTARLWGEQLGGGPAGEPGVWAAAAGALVAASAPVPAHPGVARLLARCDEIDEEAGADHARGSLWTSEVRALLTGGDPQ
ncbi:MAG: hypothetical protein L0I24_06945 [Pseudonocardia sp.]|nr:hypothetical protein [Pseudonocardia sp.]